MIIPVAHDFICPWCWIGISQARRLQQEFGVQIEWLAYELLPETMEWPEPPPKPVVETERTKTPNRIELAYAAEGMEPPTADRPKRMRSHYAHEAAEFAKTQGLDVADAFIERLYYAYWTKGLEINNPLVLTDLANGIVNDIPEMLKAIEEKRFAKNIIAFDEPAYSSGVYYVPTFFINGQKFAEQPYAVIRKAFGK